MKKTSVSRLSVLFFLLYVTISGAEGLGVNISLPERGGTFVDMIKEHHRWLDPGTWSSMDAGQFDAQGWPTVNALLIMDLRPVAEWSDEIDDPEEYRVDLSGTYSGRLLGMADVQSWEEGDVSNVVYNESSNTTTFDFVIGEPHDDGYGFMVLAFLNTQRTPYDPQGSGITDLQLIRPGYEADTDQTFLDEFVYALTHPKFAAIRFKDFTGTDSGDPEYPVMTEWSSRSLITHASQQRIEEIGKLGGAAWEYVIELANLVEIDPWINVPVSATEDYIIQLATMFLDHLDPDLNIYVESSNEVWNTAPAFQQSQWNQAQAEDLGIGEHENHARRTVEIAQIFATVFGEEMLNNKIRVVLCSHYPMLQWWVKPFLTYLENNVGDPSQYIYALSCQSYYSGGADAGESVEKILADCRENIDDMINDSGAGRIKWIQTASDYGFVGGFCFYEGGPDHGGGSTMNLENRIDAERSEGMAEVFKYNYHEGFFHLGGNIAIQFTLTSSYNRYGCWGLTDDITDPDRNYKFQAARELINQPSSVKAEKAIATSQLMENYPNPFNPKTQIVFTLLKPMEIKLEVFNMQGRIVTTLVRGWFAQGNHHVIFNGSDHPSGVYVYRLTTPEFTQMRKMIIMK